MKPHATRHGEPRKIAPESERLCAATGKVKAISEMIRFVIGPDQLVVPDLKRRLPGRGIWVTANREALKLAVRRKSFERSFKRDLSVSHELVELTERLLQQAVLDSLAVSHKAGKVAIGFAKSQAALSRERVVALIHAREAATDGVRKLDAVRNARKDASAIAVIDEFTIAQFDLALGRPNVVHAALLACPENEAFLARAARLRAFRTASQTAPPVAGKRWTQSAQSRAGEPNAAATEMRELD